MTSAYLKSRIRGQVVVEFGTDYTIDKLNQLGASISGEDSEPQNFVIGDSDYHISGQLDRWEGTNTRIRYSGNIKFEPFNSDLRTKVSVVILFIAIILSVIIGVPLSIQIFGTDGIFTFYNTHYVVAFLVGGAILIPLLIFINRDPQSQGRWRAQQKLGEMIEKIKVLGD
ncbi:MAG: hypothetical protein Phog2KO_00980 [Phototrophicaceae bacterium]